MTHADIISRYAREAGKVTEALDMLIDNPASDITAITEDD